MENNEWVKSDDFQYIIKLKDNLYRVIEANETPNGNYLLSEPMEIDLKDYIKKYHYTDECKDIIESFYKNVQEFESFCPNIEDRRQFLAEMIYESISGFDPDFEYPSDRDGLTEEEVNIALEYYMENEEYPDMEEIEEIIKNKEEREL